MLFILTGTVVTAVPVAAQSTEKNRCAGIG